MIINELLEKDDKREKFLEEFASQKEFLDFSRNLKNQFDLISNTEKLVLTSTIFRVRNAFKQMVYPYFKLVIVSFKGMMEITNPNNEVNYCFSKVCNTNITAQELKRVAGIFFDNHVDFSKDNIENALNYSYAVIKLIEIIWNDFINRKEIDDIFYFPQIYKFHAQTNKRADYGDTERFYIVGYVVTDMPITRIEDKSDDYCISTITRQV